MEISFCQNCGKNTGHKRALGAGTILGAVVTGGVSLLGVPFYGKRCVICGLTAEQAAQVTSKQSSGRVTAADEAQGWLVLFLVICLLMLMWHCGSK